MTKNQSIISGMAILALTAIVISAFYFFNKTDQEDRFSVSGSAVVYAKADIANISVGLKTEVKKTAAEATLENSKTMNKILEAVRDLEIEDKDIKTTNYNLRPVYNWTESRGQELKGYEVSQNVTLKIRNLESIGAIIERTTELGANQVGDINFTIDDEFELKNEAREMAIEKAKEKAGLIASQAGLKLGKLKGVSETSYSPIIPTYSNAMKEMAFDLVAGGAPSIEVGQNEIRAEVTLIYEVK